MDVLLLLDHPDELVLVGEEADPPRRWVAAPEVDDVARQPEGSARG